MRFSITFATHGRQELVDITDKGRAIVAEHGGSHQLCTLYALGATAAVMIQENWDPNIPKDVITCLNRSYRPHISFSCPSERDTMHGGDTCRPWLRRL